MISLATCMVLAVFQEAPDYGTCEYYKLPVHGTIRGNTLYGFFGTDAESNRALATCWANAKPPKLDGPFGVFDWSVQCNAHCRQHFIGEWLWFCYGPERIQRIRVPLGTPIRPMMSGGLPTLLDKYEDELGKKYQFFITAHYPARGVAMDFAPLSEKTARVFFFVIKTKKIESWETEMDVKTEINARGQEITRWKAAADGRKPETIESVFTEDFYVFKREADYYFVTQSGNLYVAPPPKKGEKSRTMRALWDDAKKPIVAVLSDADHDKVWLFAKDKGKDAKRDLYFEMKEIIKPESFDRAALVGVNLESRARVLLEYLPLIRKE
jgi:hypothetical protein